MTIRSVIRLMIVLAVLAVAIWFTLRSVDLTSLGSSLDNISWPLVFCVIPIILLSHYVRALRWTTILSPSVPVRRVWPALSAVLVGYASSVIIPRSGEVLRPWVFSRRTGIPLGATLSSVVVERILDVLTLLCGFGLVFIFQQDRVLQAIPSLTPERLLVAVVIPAFLLLAVIVVLTFTSAGLSLADLIRKKVHARFGVWLHGVLMQVRQGTVAIRTPALWFRLTLETVSMWLLYTIPLWLLFKAMPIASLNALGFADAAFMLVIVSIGVTIAPTPGAIGVYQGFAQTALVQVYGTSPAEGLAFGIAAWLVNYGVALVSGALCLVLEVHAGLKMTSFKQVRQDIHDSTS